MDERAILQEIDTIIGSGLVREGRVGMTTHSLLQLVRRVAKEEYERGQRDEENRRKGGQW